MLIFLLRRAAGAVMTLFVTTIVAFLIFQLLPGDAAAVIAGQGATKDQILHIRESLGLSGGFFAQFGHWLREAVLHGSLGKSALTGEPVTQLLGEQLPPTLELIAASM